MFMAEVMIVDVAWLTASTKSSNTYSKKRNHLFKEKETLIQKKDNTSAKDTTATSTKASMSDDSCVLVSETREILTISHKAPNVNVMEVIRVGVRSAQL